MRLFTHKILLLLHDLIVVILSLLATHLYTYITCDYCRFDQLLICEIGAAVSMIAVLIFNDNFYKYQFVLNRAKHTIGLIKIILISLFLLIIVSFFLKAHDITSNRVYIGTIYFFIILFFFMSRVMLIPEIYYWLVKKKIVTRNMIILGTGPLSREKIKYVNESQKSYYHIIGFVDNNAITGTAIEGYPVLGKMKDLKRIIKEYKIKDVLISLEGYSNYKLQCVIDFCKRSGRTIHVVSELYDIITEKMEIDEIGGISSFRLKRNNFSVYEPAKRAIDIVLSLIVIVGLFPFWIILTLLIIITSRGPVFYKATVVGTHEKQFIMYKFRSMFYRSSTSTHEELVSEMIKNNKPTEKLKNDPRITPIGKLLRKTSIDEFPQFINVLIGNMSIVGPRPCLPYEYKLMDRWHRKRFLVKPGITGLWQIKGRNNVRFNDQIALDLYYIENRSFRLDFEIIVKTIPVILFGKGGA